MDKLKKYYIEKTLALALCTYFSNGVLPDTTCEVHLEPTTVGETSILVKELAIALVAVDKFLIGVLKPTHQGVQAVGA